MSFRAETESRILGLAPGEKLSISNDFDLREPLHEAEELKECRDKIAAFEADRERARKRLPDHIRVAIPGEPRSPINLKEELAEFSRPLIAVAPTGEDEFPHRFYRIIHASADGHRSVDKSRGSNLAALVDAAMAYAETHDLIVVHSKIKGMPVTSETEWDDFCVPPDRGSLTAIVRDDGPVDPERCYVCHIDSSAARIQINAKYAKLASALESVVTSIKAGGYNPTAFWYRHGLTVAYLPADTDSLPPWIFGERLVPEIEAGEKYWLDRLAKSEGKREARLALIAARDAPKATANDALTHHLDKAPAKKRGAA